MSKELLINDGFYINGKKTKIISGSIHYFRVVPEYWEDRIAKLIELGCNTIETYVPWNFHEPREGEFNFEGLADLDGFLKICTKYELSIILRLSPYICAEWEFGGLPAWLLKYNDIRLRSDCKIFLEKVDNFYKRMAPIVKNHLGKNGGNIIMMQIENEYGSFSYDKDYLEQIKNIMIKHELDYNLFTSDGPWDNLMHQGVLDSVFPTGNFGSNAESRFKNQLAFVKNENLLMCMEFWDGWFDCWGDVKHNTTDSKIASKELEEVLKRGSVNLYMFHGGTNFGFWNGSNFKDKLLSRVTSYDYDAPLSEDGIRRQKFYDFQNVIAKYNKNVNNQSEPKKDNNKFEGECYEFENYSLLDNLDVISRKKVFSKYPKNMESLDQNFGYIIYKTIFNSSYEFEGKLDFFDANDRIHIFINKKKIGIIESNEIKNGIRIPVSAGENEIILMVENLGRVNYGPYIHMQKKGIWGNVVLDKIILINWDHYLIDFENLKEIYNYTLVTKTDYKDSPTLNIFNLKTLNISEDTFLETTNFNKGQIFINNFNLGRYWKIGPQKNLYIPKYLFNKQNDKIVVFETDGANPKKLIFSKKESL